MEQQQVSNRLQISALQSKLDETRHCFHDNARDPTQELRDALDAAQQSLHTKEQEVCVVLPDASASVVSRLDCACCITLASVPPSGANMASSLNPAFSYSRFKVVEILSCLQCANKALNLSIKHCPHLKQTYS